MTLPNRITMARLGLVVIFMFLLFAAGSASEDGRVGPVPMPAVIPRAGALFVFIIAVITDALDGKLARSRGEVSDLGKLLDPLADKVLTSAALVSFVQLDEIHVPAWMVVLIISREFLVTGLRAAAASAGRSLPATAAGKHKTAWQMVAIITVLGFLVARDALILLAKEQAWALIDQWVQLLVYCTMLVAVVLSVVSGAAYLRSNRDLYLGGA